MYRILPEPRRLQPFRSRKFNDSYLEQDLEGWLERNPAAMTDDEPVLVIGRQVNTASSGTMDLLAVDSDGRAIIIELKRGPTPRDIIAQALEYAAWVASLNQDEIRQLAQTYLNKLPNRTSFEEAWRQTFGEIEEQGGGIIPQLNSQQRIIIVTEGGSERITAVARYLRSSGLDITLLEYRYYRTESGEEILDLERRIGREQVALTTSQPAVTIQTLLNSWPPVMREMFYIFRDRLLTADNQIDYEAHKTVVSFYKSTGNRPVFICYFNGSPPKTKPYVAFPTSLQERLDAPITQQALEKAVGRDILVKQGNTIWTIYFPPTPEYTQKMATALIEQIISKIE
jgi:hypothetical protein